MDTNTEVITTVEQTVVDAIAPNCIRIEYEDADGEVAYFDAQLKLVTLNLMDEVKKIGVLFQQKMQGMNRDEKALMDAAFVTEPVEEPTDELDDDGKPVMKTVERKRALSADERIQSGWSIEAMEFEAALTRARNVYHIDLFKKIVRMKSLPQGIKELVQTPAEGDFWTRVHMPTVVGAVEAFRTAHL